MKIIRRISLFLVLSGVMLGLGGYGALKAEQFFYPNRYRTDEAAGHDYVPQAQTYGKSAAGKDEQDTEEQIIETAVGQVPVVTADTAYLIEEVNLSDGTVLEKEESVPVKYIGLDREKLLEELKNYDDNPPLSELEQGFETLELTAFSRDRVVICKYYRPEEEEQQESRGFYVMAADHFVVVYRGDKKTPYINTEILLESLSDALQAEIIQGKYMETEDEVYTFLESYSS